MHKGRTLKRPIFWDCVLNNRWEKYIQVVKRREPKKCLPPPAVTICAISDDFLGLNKTDPNVFGLDHCTDEKDLEKCFKMAL